MDWRGFRSWLFDTRASTDNTRRQYQRRCQAADRWLRAEGTRLDRADTADLARWMSTLPPTAASRNQARKSLCAFFAWRVATTSRTTNPAVALPVLPARRGHPRPAPDPAGVLMAAHQHSAMMGAFASLLLYAALRFTEARTAQWPDWQGDWLEITGKGGQRQAVPVAEALAGSLSRWRVGCPDPCWMFPSTRHVGAVMSERALRDRWRVVTAAAGVPGVQPHQARHRAATDALELTGRLDVVQEFLRHRSAATTRTYAATRPQAVRAAVAQLVY